MYFRFLIYLLLSTSLSFVSCENESIRNASQSDVVRNQPFKHYKWSPEEALFFSLDNDKLSDIKKRGGASLIVYHPMVVSAFNKIALDNETSSFVDSIVAKVGYPHWGLSFVYFDPQSKENITIIPLSIPGQTKVSGFISIVKELNSLKQNYILNSVTRVEIADTSKHSFANYKHEYTKLFLKYDFLIFGTVDLVLQDVLCIYADNLSAELEPSLINNGGVLVEGIITSNSAPSGQLVGKNNYRKPILNGILPEDLKFETNGNMNGLPDLSHLTNDQLFEEAKSLNTVFTLFKPEMKAIGNSFMNNFENGNGGDSYRSALCNQVLGTNALKNLMLRFGKLYGNAIKLENGTAEGISLSLVA